MPVGETLNLPLTLEHAGQNVIQFIVPEAEGELTDRNNAAVVQINGIRDRLRVLLVSGEPHPGQRTWRNLLKSDPSVDLVHFTILRPPDKQDGVPVSELSLIAFPTRELFMEAVDEFDLIIFDRYQRRGILPMLYIDNIRQYVTDGGALLLAAGARLCLGRIALSHAARRYPARAPDGPRDRSAVPAGDHRPRQSPPGDGGPRGRSCCTAGGRGAMGPLVPADRTDRAGRPDRDVRGQ